MTFPRTTIEQWAVLAAIIDRGGFAQAARSLHRSQSAVSYSVARLQQQIGVPLLQIRGRKAELTVIGKALLQRARSVIDELAAVEDSARQQRDGWESQLRLVIDAAFPAEQLLEVLAQLKAACGKTTLALDDAVLSGAEEAISNRSADVVVTTRIPPGVLGEWIMDVEFVAVAARTHPLHGLGRKLGTRDLARHTQVVVRDSGRERPRDEGWLGARHRWTVTSLDASLAAVTAGLAYAWLPRHLIAESLRNRKLSALPLGSGGTRRLPLHVVLVNPDSAGPAARLAYELFRALAPARLPSKRSYRST